MSLHAGPFQTSTENVEGAYAKLITGLSRVHSRPLALQYQSVNSGLISIFFKAQDGKYGSHWQSTERSLQTNDLSRSPTLLGRIASLLGQICLHVSVNNL